MTDLTVPVGVLAAVLGVNIRTIQRLTQEGVIEGLQDPEDKRRKVYDLTQSVPAYIAHQINRTEGKERADRISELEEKKLEAEVGLKESQRDLHQLRTEISTGRYLPIEQVQLDYEQFFIVLKKFLLSIPARVGGQVAPYVDAVVARSAEKELADEINNLLRTFVVAGHGGKTQ